MNYEQIYNNIISNAKQRVLEGYTEKHHIVPRSLGGEDTEENLVNLTAREHFICHWLLAKFTQGDDRYKMLNALRLMRAENPNQQRYETKITARVYENLKEEYARMHGERFSGENNPMYGDKFYRSEDGKRRQSQAITGDNNGAKTQEARLKISNSKQGKKRDPFNKEWKKNLSKNHKSKQDGFNGTLSEETKRKIGDAIRGNKRDPAVSAKVADKIRGSKREKKLCPHCNQYVAVNGYARWHGDNCKHKA